MWKHSIPPPSQLNTAIRRIAPKFISVGRRAASSQPERSETTAALSPARPTPKLTNPFELGSRRADFKKVEASRPKFEPKLPVTISQTPDPGWKYGNGVNDTSSQDVEHVEIDPYAEDRAMISNYKLLISGIPRPISFVSTISKDGSRNLAPMSYFQVVDHDPPIFVIGFSGRVSRPKDTKVNLSETGECVISVVTEHMIEAVNATSIDIPHGTSE